MTASQLTSAYTGMLATGFASGYTDYVLTESINGRRPTFSGALTAGAYGAMFSGALVLFKPIKNAVQGLFQKGIKPNTATLNRPTPVEELEVNNNRKPDVEEGPNRGPERKEIPDVPDGSTPHEHRYARDPYTEQLIDFEWVTTRAVDNIADKALLESAARYKGKLSNTVLKSGKGNFCYTTVDLDAKLQKNEYYAHSQVTKHAGNPNIKDISEYPENPVFKATEAPNARGRETLRDDDTEYKILNDIAKDLGNKPVTKGKITLFTEKDTCGSCNYIISQFKEKYPNIVIEVVHNRGIEITPIK